MPLEFEMTEEVSAMDLETRFQHAESCLVALMQIFASQNPVIIVIDDAGNSKMAYTLVAGYSLSLLYRFTHLNVLTGASMFLYISYIVFVDLPSWRLVSRLSREVDSILFILATRPVNRSYMAAFATFPTEYTEFVQDPRTTVLQIDPRTDDVIYNIAREWFDTSDSASVTSVSRSSSNNEHRIAELPPSLTHLILSKSRGNPLVCKEILSALTKDALIEIDEKHNKIFLSPSLLITDINALPTLPVTSFISCGL